MINNPDDPDATPPSHCHAPRTCGRRRGPPACRVQRRRRRRSGPRDRRHVGLRERVGIGRGERVGFGIGLGRRHAAGPTPPDVLCSLGVGLHGYVQTGHQLVGDARSSPMPAAARGAASRTLRAGGRSASSRSPRLPRARRQVMHGSTTSPARTPAWTAGTASVHLGAGTIAPRDGSPTLDAPSRCSSTGRTRDSLRGHRRRFVRRLEEAQRTTVGRSLLAHDMGTSPPREVGAGVRLREARRGEGSRLFERICRLTATSWSGPSRRRRLVARSDRRGASTG